MPMGPARDVVTNVTRDLFSADPVLDPDSDTLPIDGGAFVTSLGVEPIIGKPYKPTTQGKNERIHQTPFRFLGKHSWSAAWPGSRPRSRPSTSSTTPSGPTRVCPDASPRHRRGPPLPRQSHPPSVGRIDATRSQARRRVIPASSLRHQRTDTDILKHQASPES